jgi:membrane-bound inhibitor of C-type lysozyme
MKKDIIWAVVGAVLIAGAWLISAGHIAQAPTVDTLPMTATYTCDQGAIGATFHNADALPPANPGEPPRPQGTVNLSLSDGRTMTLHQTISADGVRYSDGDPSVQGGEKFVFWTKGNSALVLENNVEKSYTNCVADTN